MKKKKNTQSSLAKKIIIGVVATLSIFAICFFVFIAVLARSLESITDLTSGNACEPEYPHTFEGYAEVELPPSYGDFVSICGGFQGQYYEAVFNMNPDELDQFLATTDIQQPLLMTLSDDIKSFYFENLDVFPDATLYGVSDRYEWLEEIIVDTTDSERWVVYFTVLAG